MLLIAAWLKCNPKVATLDLKSMELSKDEVRPHPHPHPHPNPHLKSMELSKDEVRPHASALADTPSP
eukprot:2371775-Prymnesium_polylepis.1